jgi:tRNA (adenine37-N6)-methyltransferase
VFCFHREDRVPRGAAHPRGNPAWPSVGVLAGRSPVRPNHLGVSRCALLAVDGLDLTVQGPDAIDGPPVLDVSRSSPVSSRPDRSASPAGTAS